MSFTKLKFFILFSILVGCSTAYAQGTGGGLDDIPPPGGASGSGSTGGGNALGSTWDWINNNVSSATITGSGASACIGSWCAAGGSGGFSAMNMNAAGGMFSGPLFNTQINATACRVLGIPEGSFGALVMITSGLVAIVGGALGAYKLALSTLTIGAGAWILRPIVSLFFPLGCM